MAGARTVNGASRIQFNGEQPRPTPDTLTIMLLTKGGTDLSLPYCLVTSSPTTDNGRCISAPLNDALRLNGLLSTGHRVSQYLNAIMETCRCQNTIAACHTNYRI
jgi:hypothetical protein